MKDEWRMTKDEQRMMKDDDFKLLRGLVNWQTNGLTNCRVAFATWKNFKVNWVKGIQLEWSSSIKLQWMGYSFSLGHPVSNTFFH